MSNKKLDTKLDISKWNFNPPDRAKWVEAESSRLGVTPANLDKAFAAEFTEKHDLEEPLEVPDVLKITYKYSYGGQSAFFRALRDYGKLLGAKCDACNFTYCPPRKNCSKCYGDTRWVELPGTGKIESFTTIYRGTSMIKKGQPVICAYIRLDETDFVMLSNVEMSDVGKASVGMRVKAVFKNERIGRVSDFFFTADGV